MSRAHAQQEPWFWRWLAHFEADADPVRVFLLARLTWLLLAFDCWTQHLPRAARYGVDPFNLAHFGWLDRFAPPPTPALYASVLVISGLLACVAAIVRGAVFLRVNLLVLYSYGWAMSLLDGYQHHYLLSWLLLCSIFFPRALDQPFAHGAERSQGRFGYSLACVTLALVYLFAALAKVEGLLRGTSGFEPLLAVSGEAPLLRAASAFGLSLPQAARGLEWGAAMLEVGLAAAYLLARPRAKQVSRSLRWLGGAALVAALLLHGTAQGLGLKIGWLSAYMLVCAATTFAPRAALVPLVRGWTLGLRALAALAAGLPHSTSALLGSAVVVALGTGAALLHLGLPGARESIQVGALSLGALVLWAIRSPRPAAGLLGLLAVAVSSVAFLFAVTLAGTRADYDAQLDADRALRAAFRR